LRHDSAYITLNVIDKAGMQFEIYERFKFPYPFLVVDEDGELAKIASPRTSPYPDLQSRINALMSHLKPEQGVALTVEELCPGGLDPTDGIAIAQAFEKAGAKFMIASGGTRDFPALKYRRTTQTTKAENYAWLASAHWLIGRVSIPVYAAGPFELPAPTELIQEAKACGFAGLVAI
jgi:hypothetical protein